MKRVVVTPAGRRRYLELLYDHLASQRASFDRWELWLNTWDEDDVAYCDRLAAEHEWIVVVRRDDLDPSAGSYNIHLFFQGCERNDTVYLRLDDDIVYLSPGFVESMFAFRLAHPEYYLVYANIINNAVVSHLHMRANRIRYPAPVFYACMDDVGWKDPRFAEHLHRTFLADAARGAWDAWTMPPWVVWPKYNERVSINCISWIGYPGPVGNDEEQWLSVDYPALIGKNNIVHGGAICAHFGFYPQREHLDTTDILDLYRRLVPM